MKCPRCDGTGKQFQGAPPESSFADVICIRCLGLGEVPREMLKWMDKGDKLKERIAELKMYGEEVEKATQMTSSDIYRILDGLVAYPTKPNPLHQVNEWVSEQTALGLWPPRGWDQRI